MIFLRACCKNAADLRSLVARATCHDVVIARATSNFRRAVHAKLRDAANPVFCVASRGSPRRRKPAAAPRSAALRLAKLPLAIPRSSRMYRRVDALARAYGPWWLCNDVTRPFWQPGPANRHGAGPEREDGMVAFRSRGVVPCPDDNLRGTRLRGRGNRVIDPSSLG